MDADVRNGFLSGLMDRDGLRKMLPGLPQEALDSIFNGCGRYEIGGKRYVTAEDVANYVRSLYVPGDNSGTGKQARNSEVPEERKRVNQTNAQDKVGPIFPVAQTHKAGRPSSEDKKSMLDLIEKLNAEVEKGRKEKDVAIIARERAERELKQTTEKVKRLSALTDENARLQKENQKLMDSLRQSSTENPGNARLRERVKSLEHDLEIIKTSAENKDERITELETECSMLRKEKPSADYEELVKENQTCAELLNEAQASIDRKEEELQVYRNAETAYRKEISEKDALIRELKNQTGKMNKAGNGLSGLADGSFEEFYPGEIMDFIRHLASSRAENLSMIQDAHKREYDLARFVEQSIADSGNGEAFRKSLRQAAEEALNGNSGRLARLGFMRSSSDGAHEKHFFRGNNRYAFVYSPSSNPRTRLNSISCLLGTMMF